MDSAIWIMDGWRIDVVMDKEIKLKIKDILDKWGMFLGQRAGRELWSEKPIEIQDKDIEDFNMDLEFIRKSIFQ